MNKKYGVLLLAVVMTLFFGKLSFTQDQPAIDSSKPAEAAADKTEPAKTDDAAKKVEPAKADESKPAEADPLKKEEVVFVSQKGAKAYSDGYNTYINSKVLFELKTADNIYEDQVFYKINETAETKYVSPFSIEQEGKASIVYYSVDKVGNKEYQKDINVIVDNTAPEVVVTLSAPFIKIDNKYFVSDTFVYTYSVTTKDNLSGVANVQYSSDGQTYQEFIAPVKISSPDGPLTLKVLAIDNVANSTDKYVSRLIDESGNAMDRDPNVQFIVDKKGPSVVIKADKEFVAKDGKKIASKDYNYTIEAADDESGIREIFYRLDSKGEFIPYTGAIQLKSNGEHVIEAVAKDKVGNMSKTATLKVFVDIIAPTSEIKMVNPN